MQKHYSINNKGAEVEHKNEVSHTIHKKSIELLTSLFNNNGFSNKAIQLALSETI